MDRFRIPKYAWFLRNCFEPQLKQEVFETYAICSRKPPIHRIKDPQDDAIRGKSCQKELIKVTWNWNCLQRSWLLMHLRNYLHKIHSALFKLFTGPIESGKSMGGCNWAKVPTFNVPKCYRVKVAVFWQETSKGVKILLSGSWFLPNYVFCWNYKHSHSR